MEIFARHGDLVIEKTTITGKLEKATNLVLAGADTSPHTLRGKVQMRRDGRNTLVRLSKRTKLTHSSRHEDKWLPKGDYTIRPLREAGDVDVVD